MPTPRISKIAKKVYYNNTPHVDSNYVPDETLSKEIIQKSIKNGFNPFQALGFAYQETGVGKQDYDNPFSVLYNKDKTPMVSETTEGKTGVDDFFDVILHRKKIPLTNRSIDIKRAQRYNGTGLVGPKTEQLGKKIYGVSLNPGEAIDMKQTPFYGRNVITYGADFAKNPKVDQWVKEAYIQSERQKPISNPGFNTGTQTPDETKWSISNPKMKQGGDVSVYPNVWNQAFPKGEHIFRDTIPANNFTINNYRKMAMGGYLGPGDLSNPIHNPLSLKRYQYGSGGEINTLGVNYNTRDINDKTLKVQPYDETEFSRYSPKGITVDYNRRLSSRDNDTFRTNLNGSLGVDEVYKRTGSQAPDRHNTFTDYQKSLMPNFKAGVQLENYQDPRNDLQVKLQGGAGVSLGAEKLHPYLEGNISGRYNVKQGKRRLGYAEVGGNLVNPINFNSPGVREVSTASDLGTDSTPDQINTNQRKFNAYGELGVNLNKNTRVKGRLEHNLFTDKNDYSVGVETKFADGGAVTTADKWKIIK